MVTGSTGGTGNQTMFPSFVMTLSLTSCETSTGIVNAVGVFKGPCESNGCNDCGTGGRIGSARVGVLVLGVGVETGGLTLGVVARTGITFFFISSLNSSGGAVTMMFPVIGGALIDPLSIGSNVVSSVGGLTQSDRSAGKRWSNGETCFFKFWTSGNIVIS